MELTSVILGPVVTEKAEASKASRVYVLRVHPHATKVDVKNALRRYYDVDVASVRALRTVPKSRLTAKGPMEKRHRSKRMMVRLASKSKPLDLSRSSTVS